MKIYGKSKVEFKHEVYKVLAWHATKFHQIQVTLRMVLAKLKLLWIGLTPVGLEQELNPFASREMTHCNNQEGFEVNSLATVKLSFPTLNGEDPNERTYQVVLEKLSPQMEHLLKPYFVACETDDQHDNICLNVEVKQPHSPTDTLRFNNKRKNYCHNFLSHTIFLKGQTSGSLLGLAKRVVSILIQLSSLRTRTF